MYTAQVDFKVNQVYGKVYPIACRGNNTISYLQCFGGATFIQGSGGNAVTYDIEKLWGRGTPLNEWHTWRILNSGNIVDLYQDDIKIITQKLNWSGTSVGGIFSQITNVGSGSLNIKNWKVATGLYPPRKKCTFWNTLGSNAEILTSRIGNGGWFSGVSYLGGKFGNGMATTANNQYVAFGDTLKHIHQNQGTIEFWYQPHFNSGRYTPMNDRLLFSTISGSSATWWTGGWQLKNKQDVGIQTFCYSGGATDLNVSLSGFCEMVSGQLYHLAFSWDNTIGMNIYVDGQLKRTLATTWKNDSCVRPEFVIENYHNLSAFPGNSTIDNLKIYNFYMSSGINDKLIYNNRDKEGLTYKPSGTIQSTTYDFIYSGDIDYGAIRWINTGNISGKADTKSTDTGWDFSSANLYVADNALMTTSQGVSQRDRYAKWQMQLLTADQTTSPTLSGKVEIDYYDKMFHESGYFETRVLRFNDVFVSGVGYNLSPLSLSWNDSKVNIYDVKLQKRDHATNPSGLNYEWSNSASTFATTSGYSTDNETLNGYFQFKIFFSGSLKYTPTLSGIVLNERYGDAASGIWTSPIMDLSAINIKNLDSFTIVSEAPTTEQVELLYRGGNNINDFIWKQWYGVSGYGTSFLLNGTGSPLTSTFTVDPNFNLKNNRYFQYMIMLSGVAETKSAKVYKTFFNFDAERTEIPRFIGNITDISPSFGTSEDLEVAGYEKCRFALSNKRLDWEFKNYYIEDVYKYIIDLIKDEVDVCYMTKASGDFESSIHETSGKAEEIFIDINRYNGDTITSIFDELATVSTQEWWTQPQLTSGNVIKNVVYVKPRPDVTDVSRNYHKGKDLMNVQISESTKGLMNRGTIYAGYFSGTTNRIVEFLQDEKSINKYGLREFVLHDDSVTSSGYARFKLQAELDKNANPEIQGSCQIVPGDENLQVNDMIYLRGWFDTPVAEGWGSYQLKFTSEKITNNLPEDGSYTSQTDFSNKRPNIDDMQKDMMSRIKNLEQANEPLGYIEYIAEYMPATTCSGELSYTPSGEAEQINIRSWED
jgi:hypothetical protein